MTITTPYGTVSLSTDGRPTTVLVSSGGTLTLPAGDWRVVQVASDNVGGQSTTREQFSQGGALVLEDINHLGFRQDSAGELLYALSVELDGDHDAGEWVDFPLSARPSHGSALLGAHIFASSPFALPSFVGLDALAAVDALPSGAEVVRLGLPWAQLQPNSASTWDPTAVAHYDAIMAGLGQRGIAVMLTVGTTPSWARSGPNMLYPADNPATFGQWVGDILDRWSASANIISIDPWNEPDHSTVGIRFEGTAADMAGMIAAAHSAAAGRAEVTTPALAGGITPYLGDLFDAGLTNSQFDGVDIHPYPIAFTPDGEVTWLDPRFPVKIGQESNSLYQSSPLGALHGIEAELDARGMTNKSIYVSEVGVAVNPRDNVPETRMTDQRAADWHTTILDQLRRHPRVEAVIIHEATDVTGFAPHTSWNAAWGLTHEGGARRQKWYSLEGALV